MYSLKDHFTFQNCKDACITFEIWPEIERTLEKCCEIHGK